MTNAFQRNEYHCVDLCLSLGPKGDHNQRQIDSAFNDTPSQDQALNSLGKNSAKGRKDTRCAPYYWSDYENRKYIQFLKDSGKLLQLPPKQRKMQKVNLKMSRKIKTRNYVQCRTHHQKMMQKYGSIENIIKSHQPLFLRKVDVPVVTQQSQYRSLFQAPSESQLRAPSWRTTDQILGDLQLPMYSSIDEEFYVFNKSGEFWFQRQEEEDFFNLAQW